MQIFVKEVVRFHKTYIEFSENYSKNAIPMKDLVEIMKNFTEGLQSA